jgi:hypothetical protein
MCSSRRRKVPLIELAARVPNSPRQTRRITSCMKLSKPAGVDKSYVSSHVSAFRAFSLPSGAPRRPFLCPDELFCVRGPLEAEEGPLERLILSSPVLEVWHSRHTSPDSSCASLSSVKWEPRFEREVGPHTNTHRFPTSHTHEQSPSLKRGFG